VIERLCSIARAEEPAALDAPEAETPGIAATGS